jgi:Divergent InlB B-repeat domain
VPGRWYVGVKSDPLASVRTASGYRLKAHSGVVTDLNLTTTVPLTNQNLAERDWRYYRFTIPRTGIPAEWRPFFSRNSGGALAYIRDGLPPFSFVPAASSSITSPTFIDWSIDAKNLVPETSYLRQINPGTLVLPTPPLRPGSTYFMGIYGSNAGGSVEVSSALSAAQILIEREMVYNSGSEAITVPANSSRLVRIAAASDATRLKIECIQSAVGLALKLEQGAPPFTSAVIAAHAQNAAPFGISHVFNQTLSQNWPFVAGCDYYLLMSNTTTSPITSTVNMRGSSLLSEDEDNDGMGDAWERLYFGSLSPTAAGDFDGDGSSNLQEYLHQTLPKDASSVLYLLTLRAPGGSATASPSRLTYSAGATVQLAATPAAGDTFRQWRSSLVSLDQTANLSPSLSMTANVEVTAEFQTTINRGLDSPASRTWTESGAAWFGQYQTSKDGIDSVASPALGAGQQSRITSTFIGPGTLTFWWKVSSQANNGVLALLVNDVTQPSAISGTTADWTQRSVVLPAGTHRVAWRYSRTSSSTTAGDNRGYVDLVSFTGDAVTGLTFADWTAAKFTLTEQTDSTISGPNADPDQDSIPNILEAAMGTLPKTNNGSIPPLSLTSTSEVGGSRINVLSSKRAEAPVVNVTLAVQASSSLQGSSWTKNAEKIGDTNWILTGATMPTVESTAIAGCVTYSINEAVTLPLGARRFYRLVGKLEASSPSP